MWTRKYLKIGKWKSMKKLITPISQEAIREMKVGDMVLLSGIIYCGRDAVLPKIVELAENGKLKEQKLDLDGSVIFHTAVSPAGVGPTSSNKLEIEASMDPLSRLAGIRIHLGKGKIKKETVISLQKNDAVYAVIPPVTALLNDQTDNVECVAYSELGMEALYRVEVKDYPIIIAAAEGMSIYDKG